MNNVGKRKEHSDRLPFVEPKSAGGAFLSAYLPVGTVGYEALASVVGYEALVSFDGRSTPPGGRRLSANPGTDGARRHGR